MSLPSWVSVPWVSRNWRLAWRWFFLLTQLILQRAALLLLLLHRFFFLGDALLDVFQLGFIVFRRLAGERQQQDASAKYAGAHGGEHPWRGAFRQRSAACVCASGYP